MAPPVKAKPAPTSWPAAEPEPKPTPPPAPRIDTFFTGSIEKDMKNTLTPGDPGSDVSPFFTPEKPKPEAPAVKPRVQTSPIHPVHVAPPKPPQPAEKMERTAPAEPEPARHEPSRQEPARHEAKSREAEAIASTDIFQDFDEPKEKKGFPKIAFVGIGVVAVAAVGFILLRPKHTPPAMESQQAATQTVTDVNTPSRPIEEAPASEVKPAPVKQKPQAKRADPGPAGADAILPTGTAAATLPLTSAQRPAGGTDEARTEPGTNTAQADPPPVKTESVSPPVVTETVTDPAQNAATDPGTAANTTAAAPGPAPVTAPVNEGDLVELGSATEQPQLVKSSNPVYPQTAQRLGIGGQITVNALIDEKGNVIDTGILKGIQDDKGLARAAETAVKKWKFQPARKNGVAVKVWKSFVIAFKADPNLINKME